MKITFNRKAVRSASNIVLSPSRLGVFMAAACLTAATGYMNVSAWVQQGATTSQKFTNGAIGASLELFGVSLLAWAAVLLAKDRPLRAMLTSMAALGSVYFNTNASQGYFENQDALRRNIIEGSVVAVDATDQQIERLERQIDDIRFRYDGQLPRTEEELAAAYSWLADGLEANPRNKARHDSELAARRQYETLIDKIDTLRRGSSAERIASNDEVRPVIDPGQRLTFIWFLEALKAGAFFLLGTGKLSKTKKRQSTSHAEPKAAAPTKPSSAPVQRKNAKQWAIIRAKQRAARNGANARKMA